MGYRMRGMGDGPDAPPPATGMMMTPQFALLNLSDPSNPYNNKQFKIGDRWKAFLSQAAINQPVSVMASQDGRSLGTSVVGHTDANGSFELEGVMDPSTVGTWNEVWSAPGGYTGYPTNPPQVPLSQPVSFVVVGPPTPASTGGGGVQPPPPPPPNSDGGGIQKSPVAFAIPVLPWWGWLAIGGGVLLLVGGGRGQR